MFLSDKEEQIIADILKNIQKEYRSNIDKFSHELIVEQLEWLLIYSERFYERQFITRTKTNIELVEQFEERLNNYFKSEKLLENVIPTVITLADKLHISANYLGSLLRLYTKQNTQQHIQSKLIEYAKKTQHHHIICERNCIRAQL